MLKTRWSESGWPVKVSDGRWPMADGRNSWSNSSRSSRSSASSDTDAIPDLIPISIHRGRCRHGHQLQPNYRNPIRTDKSILTQMLDFFLGGGTSFSSSHHKFPISPSNSYVSNSFLRIPVTKFYLYRCNSDWIWRYWFDWLDGVSISTIERGNWIHSIPLNLKLMS